MKTCSLLMLICLMVSCNSAPTSADEVDPAFFAAEMERPVFKNTLEKAFIIVRRQDKYSEVHLLYTTGQAEVRVNSTDKTEALKLATDRLGLPSDWHNGLEIEVVDNYREAQLSVEERKNKALRSGPLAKGKVVEIMPYDGWHEGEYMIGFQFADDSGELIANVKAASVAEAIPIAARRFTIAPDQYREAEIWSMD